MTNRSFSYRHHRVVATSTSISRTAYTDDEFGVITYRRIAGSRHIRIRMSTNGELRATLPPYASLKSVKQLVDASRDALRKLLATKASRIYTDRMTIGHSHTLRLVANRQHILKASVQGQIITVTYPLETDPASATVQAIIRDYAAKALRKESKAYLPRRLSYLAAQGHFSFERVRFAHQSGRWGSCSSNGTISLNIALMTLPLDLVDYVLVHELAHTRQMNHSTAFWNLVTTYYPNVVAARRLLKSYNPYL